MPLDEIALRKPGFLEGHRIRLGDGQEWSFPAPRLRLVPRAGDGGRIIVGIAPTTELGPDFERWFGVLMGVMPSDPMEEFEARFGAAATLLQRNYELAVDDLASLIYYDRGEPECIERWAEIERVIVGDREKKEPSSDT